MIDTKARKLFVLFGGVMALAKAIGVNFAVTSRWDSTGGRGGHGLVPSHYNARILTAARRAKIPEKDVIACLETHTCPCCGRPLGDRQALDKRKVKTARGK